MNMRKIIMVVVTLLLFSILTVTSAYALFPKTGAENTDELLSYVTIEEIDDIEITSTNYGPGSEIPWYDPIGEVDGTMQQVAWLSNVEPDTVTWSYYDPMWHLICTDTHTPSFKQQGSFESGGKTYTWAYADYTTFTVPAFPPLGDWWGTPKYTLVNGEQHKGAYTYYCPISNPGTFWDNLFNAPLYFFGLKFPALFWLLGLIWIPGLFLLIIVIWGKGIVGAASILAGARDAARRARSKWREGKKKKEKTKQF